MKQQHVFFWLILLISIITIAPVCAIANVINIPDDFETIQAGINAADNGDTVLIAPGEYMENLVIRDKAIFMSSLLLLTDDVEYISSTIVDGGRNGSTLTLEGTSSTTVVKGLTLRNGFSENGGGINCLVEDNWWENAPTMFEDLVICDNEVNNSGGGMFVNHDMYGCALRRVIVRDNLAGDSGGGIFGSGRMHIDESEIRNNASGNIAGGLFLFGSYLYRVLIANNSATNSAGGIYYYQGRAIFDHITVVSNVADEDSCGGIFFDCLNADSDSSALLTNSIVFGNTGHEMEASWCTGELATSYSNIEGGLEGIVYTFDPIEWRDGNIDSDPLFINPANGDFRLSIDSPCIDAGDPESALDPDGTRADMGAFYFHQRDIAVEPTELHFEPIGWGERASQQVEIRNEGGTTLHILEIPFPLGFSSITFFPLGIFDPPIEIAPDSVFILTATFEPNPEVPNVASCEIISDDPDEEIVSIEATGEVSGVNDELKHPTFFTLSSPYPNPFNSTTTIGYSLPVAENVSLAVYDLSGREVALLVDGAQPAGTHEAVWSADGVSSGVYVVKMTAGAKQASKKILLVR